jgi:Short repeat of unknown function (DUF308)
VPDVETKGTCHVHVLVHLIIVRGVLVVIVGIIAIAWPGVTILALVILFAIYAFMAAALQAVRAFSSGSAGPVLGHLLLGLIDLAAGIVALAWPGPTALVFGEYPFCPNRSRGGGGLRWGWCGPSGWSVLLPGDGEVVDLACGDARSDVRRGQDRQVRQAGEQGAQRDFAVHPG